jgi:hypothetical protein
MSEINPTTVVQQPGGTDGNPPAATPPQSSTPATDDETVTLNKEDYNNLIAQRDRANNDKGELNETVLTLAEEREERIKKEMIGDFLEQNKDKFPDLTTDDLMAAGSPDELETLATKRQRRYEDVVQEKLLKVQKTTAPVLSPEERAEELKRLKQNPGSDSFQRALELQQNS